MKTTNVRLGSLKRRLAGHRLSLFSTAVLIILMLIYLFLTIFGSSKLAEQTDIISEHPFEVVISAGELKLSISEMKVRTERLLMYSSAKDIDIVEDALEELYTSIKQPLSQIETLYLGKREDVIKLKETLALLQKEQDAYLSFVPDHSAKPDKIRQYEQENLYPLYEKAIEDTEKIINVAEKKKVGYGKNVESLRKNILFGAVILLALMLIALITSQLMLWRQRKELVLQNKLLEEARLNAEKANTAKSDFLSRMSHEIRTPLNAIIGFTTIAEAAEDPVKNEEYLEKINLSSRHLLMLINDILDMSKIESSKMTLQDQPFNLMQLIDGFVSIIMLQAKEKDLQIEKQVGDLGTAAFRGDPLRLNQILLNLGSNAVKFTPPGGKISFQVSIVNSTDAKDTIRFALSDTGIGMSKEALERIFEPFEQADASIAQIYGGTGLGMSITKQLVALMGGQLKIESEPGKGTCCIVELAFERSQEARALKGFFAERKQQDTSIPDKADKAELLKNMRILVAEDNELNREIAEEMLSMSGAKVSCAENGQAALDLFLRSEPGFFDAILMDIQMPVMDGYEAARKIRQSNHPKAESIPIIAATANAFSEDISAALSAGMNAHISKPLDFYALCGILKEYVQD